MLVVNKAHLQMEEEHGSFSNSGVQDFTAYFMREGKYVDLIQ